MKETATRCAITDAKARLTDLVRRAEGGEDVVLTRHGQAVVRLVPIQPKPSVRDRVALLSGIRSQAAAKVAAGASAARSQDFLYQEDGMPK